MLEDRTSPPETPVILRLVTQCHIREEVSIDDGITSSVEYCNAID